MVLAYWGDHYSEKELITILGVRPYVGTLVDNVTTGLGKIGIQVKWFEDASIAELKQLLNGHWPIIVFLSAQDLQSDGRGYHALVVYGIESGRVFCHDPLQDKSRIWPIPAFRTAWAKTDYQGLVIWR